MDAARKNRWGHRDATMVLVAYRHGFRPAELVDLRWDQIDFASGALHVRRVKRGMSIGVRSGPQIGIQGGPPRFAFRTISVRPVGAGRGCGDGASAGLTCDLRFGS
jgi:integrase